MTKLNKAFCSLQKNSLDVKNIVNENVLLFDHRSAAKGKKFTQSFAEKKFGHRCRGKNFKSFFLLKPDKTNSWHLDSYSYGRLKNSSLFSLILNLLLGKKVYWNFSGKFTILNY